MTERTEALVRIAVGIVSGIILGLWMALIKFLTFVNWVITLVAGKRNKGIAEFCEVWNTQVYIFIRYMTFVSNKRPFPFRSLEENISKSNAS